MTVIHRLVGYDPRTDAIASQHDIPSATLARVKRIAEVPSTDPDAADSYVLTAAQAREVAALLGVTLDARPMDYCLESFATSTPKSARVSA